MKPGLSGGYYVYVHEAKRTGRGFCVGKVTATGRGIVRAAMNSGGRMWTLGTVSGKWEILEDDLTEIEAFQLESEVVQEHGGARSNGGALTNWIPSGEDPAMVGISIQVGSEGCWKEYRRRRSFKD